MHLTWSGLILLLCLGASPLVLGLTVLLFALRWRRPMWRDILLSMLLPQCVIIALLLTATDLSRVPFSCDILLWLVTLLCWLTLFLTRWQRDGSAPLAALVSGWLLFTLFSAAFYFNPSSQSTMVWKRHELNMQHSLVLLEQGARSALDRLPDAEARELFYRAAAQDLPEQRLRYFIRRGLSPLDKGDNGYTPFDNALESHNAPALKLFLSVLTPARIRSLAFDYDPLRNLRLDPPADKAARKQFFDSMALLLAARPDWIHPQDRQQPSYLTTAIFNGMSDNVAFLQAYMPAPTGLWRLAVLALNDDTPAVMAEVRQQPSRLEESLSDGAGRSLNMMAWMIKYAPPQTRSALLNSRLIVWDHYRAASPQDGEGQMTNTLIDEARGNWRFRDESPGVLQQVLVSAIRQGATLSPVQMLAVFRYDDNPQTLEAMLKAGLACGALQAASAQRLGDNAQDRTVRRWVNEACPASRAD